MYIGKIASSLAGLNKATYMAERSNFPLRPALKYVNVLVNHVSLENGLPDIPRFHLCAGQMQLSLTTIYM